MIHTSLCIVRVVRAYERSAILGFADRGLRFSTLAALVSVPCLPNPATSGDGDLASEAASLETLVASATEPTSFCTSRRRYHTYTDQALRAGTFGASALHIAALIPFQKSPF